MTAAEVINGMFKTHFHNALDKEALTEECPECEGTGYMDESECCGAAFYGDADDDGICGKCKDHCSKAECPECNGTGRV